MHRHPVASPRSRARPRSGCAHIAHGCVAAGGVAFSAVDRRQHGRGGDRVFGAHRFLLGLEAPRGLLGTMGVSRARQGARALGATPPAVSSGTRTLDWWSGAYHENKTINTLALVSGRRECYRYATQPRTSRRAGPAHPGRCAAQGDGPDPGAACIAVLPRSLDKRDAHLVDRERVLFQRARGLPRRDEPAACLGTVGDRLDRLSSRFGEIQGVQPARQMRGRDQPSVTKAGRRSRLGGLRLSGARPAPRWR